MTRPELQVVSPNRTIYRYDSLDRLLAVEAPDGATTTFEHAFFKVAVLDPLHKKSSINFDTDGRAKHSTDFLNGQPVTTTYVYGDFDQIQDVIDAAGNVTTIHYDKRGRRDSLMDPDRGATSWKYNGFGEVVWEKNALGQVTSYKRDILGRVVERLDGDGITKLVWSTEKTGLGKVAETVSPDGTKTHFLYDDYGRPSTSTWTINGSEYSVSMRYDPVFGRPQGIDSGARRAGRSTTSFIAGFLLAPIPGGGIGAMVATAAGLIPSGSTRAQIGRAVGEMVGGAALMFLGAGGTFGGALSARAVSAPRWEFPPPRPVAWSCGAAASGDSAAGGVRRSPRLRDGLELRTADTAGGEGASEVLRDEHAMVGLRAAAKVLRSAHERSSRNVAKRGE